MFDIFKSDLERIQSAVDQNEVKEFCRLLPCIPDEKISEMFVKDANVHFNFGRFVFKNFLPSEVECRLVCCLSNNSDDIVFAWYEWALELCFVTCSGFRRYLVETLSTTNCVVCNPKVAAKILNKIWAFIAKGDEWEDDFYINQVMHILDRCEDGINVRDSVFDIRIASDSDRIAYFKTIWKRYEHLCLTSASCHKKYFEKIVEVMELNSEEQKILLQWAIVKEWPRLFKAIIDCYDADITTETKQGFNIAMTAAVSCDLNLLKWVLEKPNGESLLHHKTYNGKTIWDFARENKNGEVMNFLRDRSYRASATRSAMIQNLVSERNRAHVGAKHNFHADLHNPTSQLNALMKKAGYVGREHDFCVDAQNPNNVLSKIVRGLGY